MEKDRHWLSSLKTNKAIKIVHFELQSALQDGTAFILEFHSFWHVFIASVHVFNITSWERGGVHILREAIS